MNKKQLVLLGDDDKDLFRYKQELNKSGVSTALKNIIMFEVIRILLNKILKGFS